MFKLLKKIHPESIPKFGTVFYNVISRSEIFQKHYAAVARDIIACCSQGKILDIGTGPGWLLVQLYQQAPNLQLVGLDLSPAMICKAYNNLQQFNLEEKILLQIGTASQLPFPAASFDAIISTGSIHHWKNPQAAFQEIYRVLKPGGTALIYDIVRNTPQKILNEMEKEFGKIRRWIFWLHAWEEPFYNQEELLALAQQSLFHTGQLTFVGALIYYE